MNPGQDVMVRCHFAVLTSQQSFFCREPCKQTTTLFGRGATKVTTGRRSVRLIGAAQGGGSVFVSVVAVTPSDSGRYRCGVGAQTYRTFVLSVAGSEFPVGLGQDPVPLCCRFRFFLLFFFPGPNRGGRQNPQLPTTTTAQAGPTTEFTTAELTSDMESKSSALLSFSPWLAGSHIWWSYFGIVFGVSREY